MYCPNCAAQNINDAKFCRACGTNLSLVPQALTGQLPATSGLEKRLRRFRQPTMAHGIATAFRGFGFLLVAFAVSLSRQLGGQVWWFWLLIPAFALLGKGVSEIVTVLQAQKHQQQQQLMQPMTALQPPRVTGEIPGTPPPSNEFQAQPVSVTETTTRHLDAVPPRNREIQ